MAVRHGFAETDSTADTSGLDAARKPSLLVEGAVGEVIPVESIEIQGFTEVGEPEIRADGSGRRRHPSGRNCYQDGGRAQVVPCGKPRINLRVINRIESGVGTVNREVERQQMYSAE